LRTILIVDDDEMTTEFVARIVKRKGFISVTAGSGKSGINFCKEIRPHAVFLDIMLPDIKGGEVYKAIKALDDKIKVFFISASDYELEKLRSQGIHGEGHFSKPVSVVDDIVKILDSLSEPAPHLPN